MIFGDSNAYRPGNTQHCWPAILQRQCRQCLRVINASCDGRTTRYDKGECNGLGIIEKKIKYARPVEFVLIALGTNDVKDKYGPPDAAEVVDGIDRIIQVIKRSAGSAKPVLLTPPPMGVVVCGDLAGAQGRIPPVVEKYRQYSTTQAIPLIDLYSTIDSDSDLETDKVHLNARGRRNVANAVGCYFSRSISTCRAA